uniref:efflux RND transporter periplasmic adaptor subunit n=1 Tax=Ideonella sp. TaxID=1929293 RepID=UPI0035B37461
MRRTEPPFPSFPSRGARSRLAVCLSTAVLAACGGGQGGNGPAASSPAASGAATGPAVSVTTVAARRQDLPVSLQATGTVTPLSAVDVKPQMSGVVQRVHVREGQFVRAGDLLFTLDDRTEQANVAKAAAQVTRDEASLADAQRQLARARELLAQGFVSQGSVDAAQANVDAQAALVQSDRAALAAARVALSHARITAPGSGRVGLVPVFPGTAVLSGQTALTTITQLDPVAVSFSLPQRHLADALAALPGGGAPVTATLPDAGSAPVQGRLQFVDSQVDAASGTVKAKAVFPNPGTRLWPGAFVHVRMQARSLAGAVVIPQAAVIEAARGPVVYVAVDGQAQSRPVKVLHAEGADAAVEGVQPGERVVLDGRQNLRPGAPLAERGRGATTA